ncbi:MAG: DUF1275 domain-containing protein [Polyangiaceae bacterium]|nr:DUF1275 domain-containing protein [Polyangiaceae bacterium]
MFAHEGPGRTSRENRLLAGYLAFVGGYVNSAGFLLIGTFTSHVTGNVGRLSNDLATYQFGAAGTAFAMLSAFFAGAFVASMLIETNYFGRAANGYATVLFGEAGLLLLFSAISNFTPLAHARILDMEAAILCCAMGMQNSLVTRLSGAVVRTTHLTGVCTDTAIEAARWFRWWRWDLSQRFGVKLSFGKRHAEKPALPKIALLLTITVAFVVGALVGATLGTKIRHAAMFVPAAISGACGVYAFLAGRRNEEHQGPNSRR